MIAAAAAGSFTPGSWIEIWSVPCVLISGSETPSLSTRFRKIGTDRSRSSLVSFRSRGGTACNGTYRPPWRSRPSVGCWWIGEERYPDDGRGHESDDD